MSPTQRNSGRRLPALELACLQALWALGQGTVQQLQAHLRAARPLAYTTVLTVMDRLTRKGVVARERSGRALLYRPLVAEEVLRQDALERLVKEFFGGSRGDLQQYLVSGAPPAGRSSPAAPEVNRAPAALASSKVGPAPAVSGELETELL
jgi:predicted transcriptional regulator